MGKTISFVRQVKSVTVNYSDGKKFVGIMYALVKQTFDFVGDKL